MVEGEGTVGEGEKHEEDGVSEIADEINIQPNKSSSALRSIFARRLSSYRYF